ncbi:MAG: disulfide bond formation protein B [Pseudomonadota bacterium]
MYGRILLAGLGSALLLAGAFAFQYLGGLAPCPLCLWQRWPHAVAIAVAALAVTVLWRVSRQVSLVGGLVMLGGAGLGGYHVGIERGWWPGPGTCSAPDPAGLSASELFDQIMATPVVRCDEVAWDFLGISMAGWNALASLALALLWLSAVRSQGLPQPQG